MAAFAYVGLVWNNDKDGSIEQVREQKTKTIKHEVIRAFER